MHSIDKLKAEGFEVTGFFYNPNIDTHQEHDLRLTAAQEAASVHGIDLITIPYDPGPWQNMARGHETCLEGGDRCFLCYCMRLEKVLEHAVKNGFDHLTSTLTISPHKNSKKIFELAQAVCGDRFLAIDFKKQDGFKKTMAMAKECGIYRQSYCGCRYSRNET